jgi:hypothetical protein
MLKELRVLVVNGREAHLNAPQHLADLFGKDDAAVNTVARMTEKWEKLKLDMTASAEKILSNDLPASNEFISKLEQFCDELNGMNRAYLRLAIDRLNRVIQ